MEPRPASPPQLVLSSPLIRSERAARAEGELFSVAFEVPGNPRGKGSPRAGMIGGHARIFTDSKTRAELIAIRVVAAAAMQGRPPYEGPVVLRLCAYRTIPAGWSGKKRAAAIAGQLVPITKPDYSNYAKMEDGITGIVWRDDAQVVTAVIHKRFSDRPRLVIDVRSAAIA